MPTRAEVIERLTASGAFEVEEDLSQGYPQRIYKNALPSFRALLESTRPFDERTYLVYGDEELTYRQHFGRVAALAHYLRRVGVKKGDRVAIGMRNYPEWAIGFWACQALGAVTVAINAWWTGPEIAFALDDSTPSALIIDGERLELLEALLADMQGVKAIVVARRGSASGPGVEFAEITATPADSLPDAEIAPSDHATILYTSGTTGKPKGAVATQRNHMTNLANANLILGGAVARGLLGDFSVTNPLDAPQAGMLQTLPIFHIGGLSGLYLAAAGGAKIVLTYKWNPLEAVRLIEKHRLGSVVGVPIVVRQLLETARQVGADISSIVGVASGGASVPPGIVRQIEEQFSGKASPTNGYGLTETTAAVVFNSGAEYFANPDSVGRPGPTTDLCIVDEQGIALDAGEIGEVWIRGPNVIPGYWQNESATRAAFGGGWFRSGDLGYLDSDGLLYIVDRIKDVIIRGGENVYCAEVEAELLEHPLVKDVAVIGIPDEEYGEQVAAVVQVGNLATAGSLVDELKAMVSGKLARFKIPTTFRLTADELPRNATGKTLKRDLRKMVFDASA